MFTLIANTRIYVAPIHEQCMLAYCIPHCFAIPLATMVLAHLPEKFKCLFDEFPFGNVIEQQQWMNMIIRSQSYAVHISVIIYYMYILANTVYARNLTNQLGMVVLSHVLHQTFDSGCRSCWRWMSLRRKMRPCWRKRPSFLVHIWVFPKIGLPPKLSILIIGFSIIFTIHFGWFSPYFWKHPYKSDLEEHSKVVDLYSVYPI